MENDESSVRATLREALKTVRPLVTLSREDLVLTALTWNVRPASDYLTATAAIRDGLLEPREMRRSRGPSSSSPATRSRAANRTAYST